MSFKLLLTGPLLALLCISSGLARVYTHSLYSRFYADGRTWDHQVVVDLTGEWKSDAGRVFRVPFSSDVHERLTLTREFFLPETPDDSLLLYFEGLSQRCEIYLNNRLLTIATDPFRPYALRLPASMLLPQWNRLRLTLREDGVRRGLFDPPPFVGAHRGVYLLKRAYEARHLALFPAVVDADSTLFLLPYGPKGYQVDEAAFKADLRLLQGSGAKALYVPYRLSNREYAWIAESGLALATRPGRWVALYEESGEDVEAMNGWPVWKTPDGSGRWGIYADRAALRPRVLPPADVVWLAGISLLLLALLAFWKTASPAVFRRLTGLGVRTGSRRDGERLLPAVILQTYAVRLLLAVFSLWALGLLLRYSGQLDWFDWFSRPSLLRVLFERHGAEPLRAMALLAGLLFALTALRQLVLRTAAAVYGYRDLGLLLLEIENRAAFPWLWGALLAGVVGLIQAPKGGLWLTGLLAALLLAWSAYRLAYIAYHSGKQAGISAYLVILYICAVELAPWVIVL